MEPLTFKQLEAAADGNNLFDSFFLIDAFLDMKRSQTRSEIDNNNDKPAWYLLFLALSSDAAYELYIIHYYYKNVYIPNVQSSKKKIELDYKNSNLKKLLNEHKILIELPRITSRLEIELIYSGYISINHKMESTLFYIKNHSEGKPYGMMNFHSDNIYDYVSLLKEYFDFELYKFFTNYVPVLKMARDIANNLKHSNGYVSNTDGRDVDLLPIVNLNGDTSSRIIRTSEQFLNDSMYSVLAVNFFFKFTKKVHKIFLLLSDDNNPNENIKDREISKLRRLCDTIKNASQNEIIFNKIIGFTAT